MPTEHAPDPLAVAALTALADGTRRRIFELVAQRPHRVGELAAQLPVSQPAVSQHLKALRSAGLVEARTEGRTRTYLPRAEGLLALRAWVDQFWDGALDAYADSFAHTPPSPMET